MKKLLSILLILALVLGLCGCAQSQEAAPTTEVPTAPATVPTAPATTAAEETVPAAAYPVTVTDQAGRTVTIEDAPETLVSGYYISTSALIALGLEERLVGIEAKAASRPIYRRSAPALLELPSVGSAKEFDLEGCAALEPDLVILPLRLESAAQTLTELGMDVLLVNPEDQALLEQMVQLLAAATDTQDRAQALLDFISDQETFLSQTLAGAGTPKVYLAGNSDLLSTAGDAMYQSDMIRLAGGANAAAELTDTYWAQISYEQLLAWDPEYIVLASDASYTAGDVLADPNLADCAAVVNGYVYQVPDNAEAWDSPVPGGILGSVWLAGILHPELVDYKTVNDVINDFYETFYGFVFSEG